MRDKYKTPKIKHFKKIAIIYNSKSQRINMSRNLWWVLLLVVSMTTLHAGKGKLRVSADQQGAYVYVDGKKKAMIGEGFSSILLEEGDYTVRVHKAIDANYEYVQTKQIFVGEDSSTKISFKLKRKITAQGRVANKNRWKRSLGTVTDTKLWLEWQDNTKAKTNKKKWSSARSYCHNLTLAGYSDWRLPTYDELLSIVDYDRYDPAIMPSFQNVNTSSFYWSSSEFASNAKDAWMVEFKDGFANNRPRYREFFVRCVRARQ